MLPSATLLLELRQLGGGAARPLLQPRILVPEVIIGPPGPTQDTMEGLASP